MNKHEDAMMTYLEGVDKEPNNEQLKQAIRETKAKMTGTIMTIDNHTFFELLSNNCIIFQVEEFHNFETKTWY